ncbi:aspartate/glutamate racemase family protein [Pelagerythrobacter marinus]|uniref:aspartate/glutamate racemase family protein n=1 Tax=Pelagerythrobacter marinus TaxID=538382 RepID=UPI0020367396|nr:amino acid racemase [Pelagerythrobacter marinus]USA38263.1 amino acid racemase [Pelagerythrobacter marinus]WPZ07775.1 amino acid racemase [Pelagerythrobacter marinus]
MRKLGLIGGMSWVSTRIYYEWINRLVQRRTQPMASAPLLIESLDFAQLYGLHEADDWARAAQVLGESARRLEAAGAGAIVIAANSMHKVYDDVAAQVDVPILHIAECVGRRMKADGVDSAALFGTRNVMTENFYRRRLVAHGVDLLPPDMNNVEALDRIIYQELMLGRPTRDSQRALKTMITRKEQDGAQAIVLACTELEMIVDVDANVLPIFDSARIHCEAAVDWIVDGA